jgi:hypothetical protein
MTNNTLFREIFGLFLHFNPLGQNLTVVRGTEQQSSVLVENQKELVLYNNSTQDSNLNNLVQESPLMSSISEACPELHPS